MKHNISFECKAIYIRRDSIKLGKLLNQRGVMRIYPMILLASFLFSAWSFASTDVVEVTYQGEKQSESQATARQEIFKEAVEKISLNYVNEIIGEQKANKNKELIKNKIIKNSGKYVLFIKADNVQSKNGVTRIDVLMKLSLKNLRTMLLEEGLLYQMDGPPKVLPMVAVLDRVNSRSLNWWMGSPEADKGFLVNQLRSFHRHLKTDLREAGFFGLSPVDKKFSEAIPAAFHNESPRTEDLLLCGDFFRAAIVVRGFIRFSEAEKMSDTYKIDVKLEALHASNGRVIGEVVRVHETETGPFQQVVEKKWNEVSEQISKDLSVQLLDAWKRGTFGATLLRLSFSGDLDFGQLAQFKKQILNQVKEIKSLRERSLEPSLFVYEADASASAKQLADAIARQKFPKFKVEVAEVRPDALALTVKPL